MKSRYLSLVLPMWLLGLAIVHAADGDCCGSSNAPPAKLSPTKICDQSAGCGKAGGCEKDRGCDCSAGCDRSASCDSAAGGKGCDSCGQSPCCNDYGLLDAVDQFAGRIRMGFINFSRRLQPNRRPPVSCDDCQTCDSSASMGKKGACDTPCTHCQKHQPTALADEIGSGVDDSRLNDSPSDNPPAGIPTRLREVPSRLPSADSQVDPFQDEPQTSRRRLPGRSNRYQRLLPVSTGQSPSVVAPRYDAQATRQPSTAEHWSEGGPKNAQNDGSITTASVELEAAGAVVVQRPYRVRVGDQLEEEDGESHPDTDVTQSPLRGFRLPSFKASSIFGTSGVSTNNNPLR